MSDRPSLCLLVLGVGFWGAWPIAGPENMSSASPATAEVVGGELVGTLGVAAFAAPGLLVSLGLSLDNNQALLVRPGITYRLR